MTTKICIVIRSFENPFFENDHLGTRDTRKIGLPESRVLYTVLRSPHIDKKSREQFEMKIKKQILVMKTTEIHDMRKKLFWLKRQRIFGSQYEIRLSSKTQVPLPWSSLRPRHFSACPIPPINDLITPLLGKMEDLWKKNATRAPGIADRYDLSEGEVQSLVDKVKSSTFRFSTMRRAWIPKAGKPGKLRPITMPFPKDILIMDGLASLLNEVYEPIFLDCSTGFRKGRGVQTFCAEVASWSEVKWVIQADFIGCFDNIPHAKLLVFLESRIGDRRILGLLTSFCSCSIRDKDGRKWDVSGRGIPQGSPVSPLLMNIYIHEIDVAIRKKFQALDYVRYADDFLLASRSEAHAKEIITAVLHNVVQREFNLQIKEKSIRLGSKRSLKVLGILVSVNPNGKIALHAPMAQIQKRIFLAHQRRYLPLDSWNNKLGSYFALYACCQNAPELEAFLKKRALLLTGEERKEKGGQVLFWKEALRLIGIFRMRFAELVKKASIKRREEALGKRHGLPP